MDPAAGRAAMTLDRPGLFYTLRDAAAGLAQALGSFLLIAVVGFLVLWIGLLATQRIQQRNLESLQRLAREARGNPEGRRSGEYSDKSKYQDRPEQRRPGEWQPSAFKYPVPPPYPDWSIEHTKPLPYRPFKHGPKYNITMGIRPMPLEQWIELDNQFLYFHGIKTQRIAERGDKLCMTAAEAFDGAIELLEELVEYLPARYPSLFRKTSCGIENVATGESFDITERPLKEDPMRMVAKLVQDDVALLMEKDDGQCYLLAGAVVVPGFWRLFDKFGMPLSEIHTSGGVPKYKEKLESGMTNFFRRIKPEVPMMRNNYIFQIDSDLAWSPSLGSEDDYGQPFHSHGEGFKTAQGKVKIEDVRFRTERQSLRRLPRTGAIIFTFRTYMFPIVDIAEEPYVPGRLASALRSWDDVTATYKGRAKWGDVVLDYLDRKHEAQLAAGLDVQKEDDIRAYPW